MKIYRFLCLLLLFCLPGHVFAKTAVSDVRIADKDGYTRLVIDLNRAAEYKLLILNNPDRFVVDIKDGAWKVQRSDNDYKSEVVSKVRKGWPKTGTMRIVFDLNHAVKIKDQFAILPSTSRKLHQLVFDIRPLNVVHKKAEEKILPEPVEVPDFIEKKPDVDEVARIVPESMKKKQPLPEDFFIKEHEVIKPEPVKPAPVKSPEKKTGKKLSTPKESKSKEEKPIAKEYNDRPGIPLPVSKPAKKIVVIDPGHGGIDPGAIGKSGLKEKDVTLEYARSLKAELGKYGLYEVFLTRDDDNFVSLKKRVVKARKIKADLFISFHADSNPEPEVRGLSVYTLSTKASDKHAAALASRENKSDALAVVDLTKENDEAANILIDLVKSDTMNNSAEFAEILVKGLGREAKLLQNTHRFAGFVVLTGIDVPSALVELGYLSNPYEEQMLVDEGYKNKLIESVGQAIDRYFDTH